MWYKNVGTGIFRFVTVHAFDGWTDGWQKGLRNTMHCITCSRAVKNELLKHFRLSFHVVQGMVKNSH